MTIKGIWDWIEKNVEYAKESSEKYAGKIVPMDILGIIYQTRYTPRLRAYKKIDPYVEEIDERDVDCKWLGIIVERLIKWIRDFKIIPLFVYDGPVNPMKLKTLEKRNEGYVKVQERINEMRNNYEKGRKLLISAEDKNTLRGLLVRNHLVPTESKKRFKKFFEKIGIPSITVEGDAERFCALMANKLGTAVMSKDGDCLAHGARKMILANEIIYEGLKKIDAFKIIKLRDVLLKMDLTYKEFLDVCIMSGTDYNENIKGVAFGKSLGLIKKYGSIENLPGYLGKIELDTAILNYENVRKEFEKIDPLTLIIEGKMETNFDKDKITSAFLKYELDDHLPMFLRAIKI